jgi:pimeloyl-ACP methyl ester carboxylesterase
MSDTASQPAAVNGELIVDGVPIRYQRYAPQRDVDVVMVHGFSGHGGWWHPTAQLLADTHGVVSVELSGHGDSGHRPAYSLDQWAAEMIAVISAVCTPARPPAVIGHSMGGVVSALAVSQLGNRVTQLVMVDSILKAPRNAFGGRWTPPKSPRRYDTLAEAVARFRLMPEEPVHDRAGLQALATRAAVQVDGAWQWKLDPLIHGTMGAHTPEAFFDRITIPVTIVRGELSSLVDPDVGEYAAELIGRPVKQLDLPGAYHHMMIDQLQPLTAVLRGILDEGENS